MPYSFVIQALVARAGNSIEANSFANSLANGLGQQLGR
jgi:hypothetical protein